ncbi:Pyruvate kinase, cytosolic isozyme [Dendrobium catenatum]|uniref:Pyruvate kinase, cytosolic isozyme n=1 Tax=Dendrobium catenatum TaxID=906689 RepID=A0A2I0WNZ3_9ASPA|nr:Pyruvate kinase, cytosolic isozyme [Dendrobium catenatum]
MDCFQSDNGWSSSSHEPNRDSYFISSSNCKFSESFPHSGTYPWWKHHEVGSQVSTGNANPISSGSGIEKRLFDWSCSDDSIVSYSLIYRGLIPMLSTATAKASTSEATDEAVGLALDYAKAIGLCSPRDSVVALHRLGAEEFPAIACSLLTPKFRPRDAGVLLVHQQTSDFYPTLDLHSSPSFTRCRTSTGYRTFAGYLSEYEFLSIVGLLPDVVLLTFIVKHSLPASLARQLSFLPPSPADYDPHDLCRPPTTVLLTYVAHRLQSFRPPSPADYSPPDLCRPLTTVFPTSVARLLRSS